MLLTISELYDDPEAYLNISYKVIRIIRRVLVEKIMKPFRLVEKDEKYQLSLLITTEKNCHETTIKGPDIDRRNKFITWGLYLPYHEIADHEDQRELFLRYFFDALVMVFAKYNVPEENIREIQRMVSQRICERKLYEFWEEPTPKIDLSDIDPDCKRKN